ncbi:MAG: TolC family protein, partial [Nitrospirales bacterium]|nr:TolC family protein [Nitrospirales bacterium]
QDPVVADPDRLYDARALLTQNLLSHSLINKLRAALAGVDVAGLDTEVTRLNTMATVGLVYLEVLRSQATVDARFADVTLNQELLRLTTQRQTAGMATLLDVNRAHVRFKNERQRWLVAKNDLIRSKLNLIRAIGLSFDVNLVLIDEMTVNPLPEQTLQEALAIAKNHRVELELQKNKERMASITLSSVTSERIPSLQASGDVGLIGNEVSKMLTNDNVQVMMSIPIFDGGQREGRISESRSRVRQEAITTRDVTYQISLEVRDAFQSLHSAKEQVTEAEEALGLSLNEVELARRRFAAGAATNIEVTDAQAAVATARDNVIEALFNFNVARIQLARAQGRLEDL